MHYLVLAILIEEVTGETYEHQAETRVFRPVGMGRTSFPEGAEPYMPGLDADAAGNGHLVRRPPRPWFRTSATLSRATS
ncbi:serine hydrolase [Streptomyces sp. B-S-A6]|uniref:Serine hydrolase n=1 Tax=Streptomyces cavernicola TaxID=3043613 RepID=A0ABT6SGF7_9ACTN|nr:serine hydrolase [Streptomyces sp. B-S-A6]MDI3407245.1 serine hydrolase [Streptomyces sp. B-S-A6]